ncbi:ABC transporter ATP-binding protein [Roseobacter denitrificans]|uniref:Putative cyclosin secreting ABC transporter, ATP binding protein n=1 Tax=Roseobacter denitrificans (strain ATCC 33942 / OCh 114) TaxID=375451 RepID=Q16CJ9_ROSDO|nr:ABC transporter transmembrane domain-containing protein [Roseobacter denitrificans]ABG30294.1 putative cyclosin secreting ABC transporter, ATP binding protein [Roseobacter denitrificans OCh 114]AVL53467.1 ABC transporter ATP-binding protein [Roseobacter denitrificans]SFF71295.1 ABC-type bacteriocin/lantibiotic exporter, contains an N-terminal double-glycine peptidase domain [Roseobacter denitrificans OCh 114]
MTSASPLNATQDRQGSAFDAVSDRAGIASATSDWENDSNYDALSAGLRSGRFGGLPSHTNAGEAVVEVLRQCNWPVDFRAFAAAVPHFSPELNLNAARGILRNLGFETAEDNLRGRNLQHLPSGSFVVSTSEDILFIGANDNGRLVLRDPVTGQEQPIRQRRLYRCFRVSQAHSKSGTTPVSGSWISNTFHRFAPENRTILFIIFLSNTLIVIASLSVGFIFDKVLPAKAFDTLVALLAGICILLYVDLRLRRIKSRIIAQVSGRIEFIVSSTLFERLMAFPLEMVTGSSASDQMNRLKHFETVRDFYAGPFVAVIFELPFVAILLAAMFFLDPVIGTILLGFVVLYALIGAIFYPKISRGSKELSQLHNECMRLQEETLSQRQQIIARGLGAVWSARVTPRFTALSQARHRLDAIWRVLNSLITVATPLATGCVIFTGALRVISADLTAGVLIACTIISARLLSPVQQALLLAVRAPDLLNLFKQIDVMMRIKGRNQLDRSQFSIGLDQGDTAPDIHIDSLVLRYPQSVTAALKGISVRFDGGSLTCITGEAGSGKSSLLRAITGQYSAQNGTVMIGQSNVNQFDTRTRASLISYLGHQSLQIHGTLAQNLRLTKPDATDAELRAVTEELSLLQSIESLSDGFDTKFSHADRHQFSPAFRTKFAVAQILLNAPRILLLDEPEAGLSDEDETAIMNAIKRRAGHVTCLLVTHRPSIMRQADKVLLLNAGQIDFFGGPEKLQSRNG